MEKKICYYIEINFNESNFLIKKMRSKIQKILSIYVATNEQLSYQYGINLEHLN